MVGYLTGKRTLAITLDEMKFKVPPQWLLLTEITALAILGSVFVSQGWLYRSDGPEL